MSNESDQDKLTQAGAMSRANYAPEQEHFRSELRKLTLVLAGSLLAFVIPLTAAWETLRSAGLTWALALMLVGSCGLLFCIFLTGKFGKLDKQ